MPGTGKSAGADPGKAAFVIVRAFSVPREFLFMVWTDPEHRQRWWGARGVTIIPSRMDLRPGGIYH